jgi:sugar/nucleoside kinase (ribokinase family)
MNDAPIHLSPGQPWQPCLLAGVGGIGTGIFFALEGDATLGRNESRPGRLLDVRDYCKLHIISHYVSVLMGARPVGGGFRVLPIGKVGDDAVGRRLIDEMAAAGMDVTLVWPVEHSPTLMSVCFQYPDGAGGNITTSNAAAALLTPADVDQVEPTLAANAGRFIALAAPEAPLPARARLLELAAKHRGLGVAAMASAEVQATIDLGLLRSVDLLALNEDEAAAFTGKPYQPGQADVFLRLLATRITGLAGKDDIRIVMSAGKDGAFAYEDRHWDFCPGVKVEVASTAGAGDALLGGVIAGLAAGMPLAARRPWRTTLADRPLQTALDFATVLAALTVTSPHTIHPNADLSEVLAFARKLGLSFAPDTPPGRLA